MTDPIDVAALVERLRQHACVIELVVATQKREPAAVMDEAARTLLSLSTRATIAEASLATMREALEPFARVSEIPPHFADADYVQMEIHYTMSPEEMDSLQRLTGGAMKSDRASLLVSLDGVNAGDFRRARRALGGSNAE